MNRRKAGDVVIVFPQDCIMLTDSVGERIGDTLKIAVRVDAPDDKKLTVNGIPLENRSFGLFKADVILDYTKTFLNSLMKQRAKNRS